MKVGVAGAGAVGCLFGGILANADYDVTFLARGKHLAAMQKKGLTLEGPARSFEKIDKQFTDDISDLADSDIVFFCFKSNDTKKMGEELKRHLKSETVIITLQNGVDNEEVLCDIFGRERVISAATYVQAKIQEPGLVRQEGRIMLVIGGLHYSLDNTCQTVVEMFDNADLEIKQTDQIMERKWKKLLWNVTFNPLSALMSVRVGEILADNNLSKTASLVCKESINVAKQFNIELDKEKTVEKVFHNATYAEKHRTSMLQDRLNEKEMEIESMCGYIIKKGKEFNVATPTLETIYHLLTFINKQIIESKMN